MRRSFFKSPDQRADVFAAGFAGTPGAFKQDCNFPELSGVRLVGQTIRRKPAQGFERCSECGRQVNNRIPLALVRRFQQLVQLSDKLSGQRRKVEIRDFCHH